MRADATRERARALLATASGQRDWFRMESSGDEADVWIYDVIGWPWITADEFVRELRALGDPSLIRTHLNTPGGDVFDGIAIYNALREHPAEIETRVGGLAASAGSLIAMAGNRIIMERGSMMMIHEPWTITWGDSRGHRKSADTLDQIAENLAGIYADRAGGSRREWRDVMLEETWYTDQEAVDAGLADEVAGSDSTVENRLDPAIFDLFRHPPAALRGEPASNRAPTKRAAERALRDVGLSQAEAKAFVARGWDAVQPTRDVSAERDLAAFIESLIPGGMS